jgi:exosome complex component RRP46
MREKSMEAHLRGILDGVILTNLHPRTSINVNIQEVQNYGSVSVFLLKLLKKTISLSLFKYISCALNSCCLALLDASIPLKYTFASVTIGFIKESHELVYFPDIEQEKVIIEIELINLKKKKKISFPLEM